jgi:multisubunit Na+/H+ antiporter MnhB subunit
VAQAGTVPHVVVLVCVAAGIFIAWHQGSHGGGQGGVVAGVALLVAAVVRLALPARLAGLLAVRHRATDVATLAVLGVSLLTVGLVLPGLRASDAVHARHTVQARHRAAPRR